MVRKSRKASSQTEYTVVYCMYMLKIELNRRKKNGAAFDRYKLMLTESLIESAGKAIISSAEYNFGSLEEELALKDKLAKKVKNNQRTNKRRQDRKRDNFDFGLAVLKLRSLPVPKENDERILKQIKDNEKAVERQHRRDMERRKQKLQDREEQSVAEKIETPKKKTKSLFGLESLIEKFSSPTSLNDDLWDVPVKPFIFNDFSFELSAKVESFTMYNTMINIADYHKEREMPRSLPPPSFNDPFAIKDIKSTGAIRKVYNPEHYLPVKQISPIGSEKKIKAIKNQLNQATTTMSKPKSPKKAEKKDVKTVSEMNRENQKMLRFRYRDDDYIPLEAIRKEKETFAEEQRKKQHKKVKTESQPDTTVCPIAFYRNGSNSNMNLGGDYLDDLFFL